MQVLTLDCNTAVAEDLAASLVGVVAGGAFSHVLAPCSNVGKNYIPRLAALCDSAPLTDVQEVSMFSPESRIPPTACFDVGAC